MIINESHILEFRRVPIRGFRWEKFQRLIGKYQPWNWQASCQFDIKIKIDPALPAEDRERIEYRQYIAGGIWIIRGSQQWTNLPNGNKHFPIPPYAGQDVVEGLPMGAVPGVGLDKYWKEDGKLGANSQPLYYGYRDSANQWGHNEQDRWTYPDASTGHAYYLRDTPSISGDWGEYGERVVLWIQLYFRGYVVEVGRNSPTSPTNPIRILKSKSWEYFEPNMELKKLDGLPVVTPPKTPKQV